MTAQPGRTILGILHIRSEAESAEVGVVRNQDRIDKTDARMLLALTEQPRATAVALAGLTGLSRNTVQARLARLEQHGVLD